MPQEPVRVLLIEDDPGDVLLVREHLAGARGVAFAVEAAARLADGLARIQAAPPDVILLDLNLPDSHGLDTVRAVTERVGDAPVIVLTGLADDATGLESFRHGAQDYLVKSAVTGDVLARSIRYAMERSRLRSDLRESEWRYRALVELAPAVTYRLDPEGRITFISRGIETFGRRAEELAGQPFETLFCPEDLHRLPQQGIERRIGARAVREAEVRLRPAADADARRPPPEVSLSARGLWSVPDERIHDPDKVFLGSQGVMHDITRRKRTEEALVASEARFRTLARTTNDAVWDWDFLTDTVWWNEAVQTLFGYPPIEQAADKNWWPRMHPADRDRVREGIRRVIESGGNDWSDEYRYLCMDGSYAYVLDRGHIIRDAAGRPTRMIGSMLDITERRRSEEALRGYAERLKILRELDEAILSARSLKAIARAALDHVHRLIPFTRGKVISFDAETQEAAVVAIRGGSTESLGEGKSAPPAILGVGLTTGEEAVGVIEDLCTLAAPSDLLIELMREGIRSCLNVPLTAGGELVGAVFLGSGRPNAFDESHRDIALELAEVVALALEQARLQEQVRRQVETLEMRVAERTEELEAFTYSVSHDLRAPLRAVAGYSKILKEEYANVLDEQGQSLLKVILDMAARMGELMDHLLVLSRLGRIELQRMPIDMKATAEEVIQEIRLAEKRLSVEPTVLPMPHAQGDRAMLRQVYANLLSNAIKFSSRKVNPVIEVGARHENGETVYYVRDTGVGFDMSQADKLFRLFQRLHPQEEFSGTGAGLAIVKRIIRRHGGRIWAEGRPGEGAAFHFTLPEGRAE